MNIHEYQGQGGAAGVRRGGAARACGVHGRGGRQGGERSRLAGRGGQGADPRRRARQGRRRQGGQVDRRRAQGSAASARLDARHPSDRPHGKQVNRLYIEEGSAIDREFYLSALVDRETSRVAFVVSTEGGMDIEEVAQEPSREDRDLLGRSGDRGDAASRPARGAGAAASTAISPSRPQAWSRSSTRRSSPRT